MMRYKSIFSLLPVAVLVMGLLAAPAGAQSSGVFAFVQLIHNVPDAGPVDIYIDDAKALDDFSFQTASSFMPVLRGKHTLDIVAGDETDNSNPLFTTDVVLQAGVHYAAVALGVLSQSVFEVLALDNLRTTSAAPGMVEYVFIHGVPGVEVDVRLLDPDDTSIIKDLLVNNWAFGDYVGYWQLEPAVNYFEVTTSDNSTSLGTMSLDVSAYGTYSLMVLVSPLPDGTFTIVAFDADGGKLEASPVTRALAATAVRPLAIQGNYPNPFNPSTSIRFDLAEAAQVRLEVVDMLGRTVMTLPARHLEAGPGHTFTVDASSLASGTYLYRLTAQTEARTLATQTGRMILSK